MAATLIGTAYYFAGEELEYNGTLVPHTYVVFANGYTEALSQLQYLARNIRFINESRNFNTIQTWMEK